jgi:hypothetical protein
LTKNIEEKFQSIRNDLAREGKQRTQEIDLLHQRLEVDIPKIAEIIK